MSYILSCPNLNILDIDISIGQISILLHYGALQISTLPPTHPLTLPPYSPTNPSPYSPTNPSPYSQPFNQLHNIFHQQQTGITPRHVRNLYNGAQERGVGSCTLLKIEHVKDRDRRGRQKKITSAVEEAMMQSLRVDMAGRNTCPAWLTVQYLIPERISNSPQKEIPQNKAHKETRSYQSS